MARVDSARGNTVQVDLTSQMKSMMHDRASETTAGMPGGDSNPELTSSVGFSGLNYGFLRVQTYITSDSWCLDLTEVGDGASGYLGMQVGRYQ